MQKGNALKKALAIAGTALTGFPILLMIVTSAVGSISAGKFLCDYLMPAELFLIVIGGGLLLLWAALWTRLLRLPIIIELVAACVFLALSQGAALLSGIASGEAEPAGAAFAAIVALLALYGLAEVELTVTGIVLTNKIFHQAVSDR